MSIQATDLDRKLEYLGAWSGIAWVIFAGAAFGGSGLIPVLSPSIESSELVAFLSENRVRMLIGMMIMLIGAYTFLMTWGLSLAYQIKQYANSSPMSFYLQIFVALNGAIIGMLVGVFGSQMLFRVDHFPPEITHTLYDLMWLLFLLPWPPFLLWQFVVGFSILSEENNEVMFPRWTGYFSLWAGMLELFSALCVFWYSGAFSYNGAITFWIPAVSFFIWVLVLTIVQIRGWRKVSVSKATGQLHDSSGGPAIGAGV